MGVQAATSGYQEWRMLLLRGRSFVPQLQEWDSPRASRPDLGLQDCREKLYLISVCSTELRER